MYSFIKVLIVCTGMLCFAGNVNGQTKKARQTKKEVKKVTQEQEELVEPPPAMEEMKEISIESIKEKIDFDTTAVPQDELTSKIREFFEVSRLMETVTFSLKKLYNGDNMRSLMKPEVLEKLLNAYEPSGLAFNYIELMYVRNFRKYYAISELEEIIKFYKTTVGQKMVKANMLMIADNLPEAEKIGRWVAATIFLQ